VSRRIGFQKESLAEQYLKKSFAFKILDRNYRAKTGEIDIIAKKGRDIYFVEVRYRKRLSMVNPEESITLDKMRKIANTAMLYIKHKRLKNVNFHFSVIAIDEEDIIFYPDAFSLEDAGLLSNL